MPEAQIQITDKGFKCYGENKDFFYSTEHEQLLAGPYETGKTITALFKLHVLLSMYPGAYALMVRKTYTSSLNSAVVTYENKVLPVPPNHPDSVITKFGGNRPEWYGYPNGSRLVIAGLDNADKVLSAEYDYIYINQAEELTLGEYETLVGRATGRAGHVPMPMVISDCNPANPTHWLKNRPSIVMYNSRHEDNPILFNPDTGKITPQGKRSIAALDALTGVRYKRGRLGLWAGVEGSVYEDFDSQIHVIDPFPIPETWGRYRVIDFGFRNPFVCQWWALDGDGRLYLYREIYMSNRTVTAHAGQINKYSVVENYIDSISDHDASDRATLESLGIRTRPAKKDIKRGIEAVQLRLKVQADGKPRIFFMKGATLETDQLMLDKHKPTSTIEEMPLYAYPDTTRGNKNQDENPVKIDDHGVDTTRYLCNELDGPEGEITYVELPNIFDRGY